MSHRKLRLEASLADCKLVFRTLHAHLAEHLELIDSEVLAELQARLQAAANEEGVDVTDHAAWNAWLGDKTPPSGEERRRHRQTLN